MDRIQGHLVVEEIGRSMAVLTEAKRLFREEFGIKHATLQVEPRGRRGAERGLNGRSFQCGDV